MATVYRRPSARRDLIAHYIYLAANAGDATADRFLSRPLKYQSTPPVASANMATLIDEK
jgi:hypothetical protein